MHHLKKTQIAWAFNFVFVWALLLSYSYGQDLFQSSSGWVFLLETFGQALILSWVSVVALPTLCFYLSLKLIRLPYLSFFAACCLSFFIIIDRAVFSLFHTHINLTLIQMALGPARSDIFVLTLSEYLSFFAVLAGIVLLQTGIYYVAFYKVDCARYLRKIQFVFFLSVLLLLSGQGVYAWADATYNTRVLSELELVPWFYGLTAKKFLEKKGLIKHRAHHALVETQVKNIHYPKNILNVAQTAKKTNIVFLMIDALRHDDFNAHTTPSIYQFSQKAIVFNNHFSGGNCTRAGLTSIFYSANPRDFDAFYRANRGPVLFDALYKQHYSVGAWSSASALSPPFNRTVFNNIKGFNPTTPGADSVARDINVKNKLEKFILASSKNNEAFFAFAFFDSVHAYNFPNRKFDPPFKPFDKINHLMLDRNKNGHLIHNQYRNAAYFVDGLVGSVLNVLEKNKMLDNTIVIITSDHGEEFDDNQLGYWGHNSNFTPAQSKVPFILYVPGKSHEVHQYVTSHYDLTPFLLKDILNVGNPVTDFAIGKNLFDASAREVILMGSYGNSALYLPEQKKIIATNRIGLMKLYHSNGQKDAQGSVSGKHIKNGFDQMHHFH